MVCTNSQTQSPIDILSIKSKKCIKNCDLKIFYSNSNCNIILTSEDILLKYDKGSHVTYNNTIYNLDKISFVNPSNHQIDGSSFELEADLYHKSPKTGKILIICIFINVNNAKSKSKLFLDSFLDYIPTNIDVQKTLNINNWNIFDLLPERKSFFSYNGSIIRNPCSQSSTWIIMNEPVSCSHSFHNILNKLIKNNSRSIQSLNARTIYYNPNLDINAQLNYTSNNSMNNHNESIQHNKHSCLPLRKKICTLNIYKNIVITIIIILLVSLILFILWLNENGHMQTLIQKFNNIINRKIIN